jgi:signal transduction histidine kinase
MDKILSITDQNIKIFVVDDTPYNLRLLTGILQRKDYQVYKALDGETALQEIPNILPDLILLDIKMRGIDGYEVCQQLKANPNTAEIPVIFISGLDDIVDKMKAFKSGGVDYITKPFQANEVLLRIENQLKLRSLQQTLKEKNILLEQTVEQLKKTQIQLVQTEKMASLGQLVAGIAHEINNPVNFIQGNISYVKTYLVDLFELIQQYQEALPNPPETIEEFEEDIDLDFLSKDLQNILNSMKYGSERIQKIVDSLRNFSRLDEAQLKKVDIHEGIESSLMMLQHRLSCQEGQRNIQVIKNYGVLPKVECYAGEINQVFMNLLNNAIDALTMPEKSHPNNQSPASLDPQETTQEWNPKCVIPKIEISTELLNSEKVQITITDNGSGIPDNIRQRLFDPFFTTKPVGYGTGLGLSISYQTIVEGHQGEIFCESMPGQGATFKIILPLQQSHQSKTHRDQTSIQSV